MKLKFAFITSSLLIGLSGLVVAHPAPCTDVCTPSVQAPSNADLRAAMQSDGIQIVQQGARVQIIIPSDNLFEPQKTTLQDDAIPLLQRVSLYLTRVVGQYSLPPLVTVTGYTDNTYTPQKQLTLSKQYANSVASFLWAAGFSPDELKVAGLASQNPIGDNSTSDGSAFNRRVVIQVNE